MTPELKKHLRLNIALCKENGNYRELTTCKNSDDFVSNDYLGFSNYQPLKLRLKEQLEKTNLGSTGSRLLSGNYKEINNVEKKICEFFKSEKAALYSSGYALNIGLLPCLTTDKDIILLDHSIHVSLKNSAKLSKAQVFYFRHNDNKHLQKRLERAKKTSSGNIFVVVESVYSMDGDRANLNTVDDLCHFFKANLVIDEAHAVGISGKHGEGLGAQLKYNSTIARIVTFGKAFGTQGAALLSDSLINNWIKNFCHSFIYTTAPSPLTALTISNAIDELAENSQHISTIKEKINYTNKIFSFKDWQTPIYPFIFKNLDSLEKVRKDLLNNKFKVLPVRSPTVKKGQERLRICIHNFNSQEKINKLYLLLEKTKYDWQRPICYSN
jgi:8-amino-7-oxononanoate synthase